MRFHAWSSVLPVMLAVITCGVARSEAPGAGGGGGGVRPSAAMLQQPDVSATDIVFVYANDIWLVPREGGMARPLASPPGRESFPKFSPDGRTIAYVGNYDGNRDIYSISLDGSPSVRVTHHPASEVVTDWTSDGRVVYYTAGFAGLARQEQVFTVMPTGGMPEKLPVPYGTTATISPDGTWLAYTPWTHDFRTWKRYRGGWATDIWLFNLKDRSSKKITDWEGTDTTPMWAPDGSFKLYYLCDDGPSHRANIWSYDIGSGAREQITSFEDYDIKWPSIGPGERGKGEIVFQNGESVYLLDLSNNKSRRVEVVIPGDRPSIRDQQVDAAKFIQDFHLSPTGKRLAFEARGDIWTVPAVEGVTQNLTRTSGIAERDPLFSPDGKRLAFLSDATGEYELYLTDVDGKREPRQLTTGGSAYRYLGAWSPDSKHIAYSDKTGTIYLHTLGGEDHDGSGEGVTKTITKEIWANQTRVSWSHDSAWMAVSLGHENTQGVIHLYEVASGTLTPVTSEMFDCSWPTFDRKGEWLYFTSSRSFTPTYSDIDSAWVYRNSEVILAVPLRGDVKNPMAPKSDAEEAKKDEKKPEEKAAGQWAAIIGAWSTKVKGLAGPEDEAEVMFIIKEDDDKMPEGTASLNGQEHTLEGFEWSADTKTLTFSVQADQRYDVSWIIDGEKFSGTWTAADARTGAITGERTKQDEAPKLIKIELGDPGEFEGRAIQLPIKPGGFAGLAVNDSGKLAYLRARDRQPGSGGGGDDDGGGFDLMLFDFFDDKAAKKEEKTIIAGIDTFFMSADGKKVLVKKKDDYAVIDAAPDQKMEKKAPLNAMSLMVSPREEWEQMFADCWRIFRDWFYDPGFHQVDWSRQREVYGKLLPDCVSRDDVTFVIAEMISEFNVGHAYYRPGDQDTGPSVGVGMLGADYELVKQDGVSAYRIKRIHQGAPWDSDSRGPLSQPGVDVKEGDFLLAVNRVAIDPAKDIWAAFIGLADKTVMLTVSDKPVMDESAREVLVKPIGNETNLRFRAWIEDNRRYTDYRSGGKVGYIYVVNTGVPGQSDLVRQFYGQRHKEALIIDDRWNGGGQIPTRFIELLNRPRTNYWARRDGKDWAWPRDSHQGPKAMLINGLSASGGDMFPALFRQNGLGKLFGTRTWGGLVGISGNPALIDGTAPSVPTFGYYQTDGTWGIEGHGVDPDVAVLDDPAKMPQGINPGPEVPAMGGDPQLDAAIEHLLQEIPVRGYRPPAKPAGPDRKGMGIAETDK